MTSTFKFTRAFGCDESHSGIHSITSRYRSPKLFYVTLLIVILL